MLETEVTWYSIKMYQGYLGLSDGVRCYHEAVKRKYEVIGD